MNFARSFLWMNVREDGEGQRAETNKIKEESKGAERGGEWVEEEGG